MLSASGASSIKVHSTTDPDFPLVQSIEGAHKVGCHHLVTNGNGSRAVSVGFGGDIKIWARPDGNWSEDSSTSGNKLPVFSNLFIPLLLTEIQPAQQSLQTSGQLPYLMMDGILLVSLKMVTSRCGT